MKKILCGILIGASYVIPGVCSATTAISLGQYDNILEITSNIYNPKIILKHWLLIISIIIGILFSLILFGVIFKNIPFILMSIFLGINIGMFSYKKINFNYIHYLIFGIVLVLLFSINLGIEYKNNNYILILCGFIVALGFILPGLSGSLLMLNLGIYEEILKMFNSFMKYNKSDILFIVFFLIGLLLGIVIWSKIFYRSIKNRKSSFLNFILGMMFSSIAILVYQTFTCTKTIVEIILSIIIIVGLSIIIKFKKKNKEEVSYE